MSTRALYPPPNHERLHHLQIPDDARRFEAWVSYATVEFPLYLEKLARLALDELQGLYGATPGSLQKFIVKYAEWWALTEEEKLHLMEPARLLSPQRDFWRRQARGSGQNHIKNGDDPR